MGQEKGMEKRRSQRQSHGPIIETQVVLILSDAFAMNRVRWLVLVSEALPLQILGCGSNASYSYSDTSATVMTNDEARMTKE